MTPLNSEDKLDRTSLLKKFIQNETLWLLRSDHIEKLVLNKGFSKIPCLIWPDLLPG